MKPCSNSKQINQFSTWHATTSQSLHNTWLMQSQLSKGLLISHETTVLACESLRQTLDSWQAWHVLVIHLTIYRLAAQLHPILPLIWVLVWRKLAKATSTVHSLYMFTHNSLVSDMHVDASRVVCLACIGQAVKSKGSRKASTRLLWRCMEILSLGTVHLIQPEEYTKWLYNL